MRREWLSVNTSVAIAVITSGIRYCVWLLVLPRNELIAAEMGAQLWRDRNREKAATAWIRRRQYFPDPQKYEGQESKKAQLLPREQGIGSATECERQFT